jgi:hypothetical protein
MVGLFVCASLPASAEASFPGQAGLLATIEGTGDGSSDVFTMRIDGTGRTRLTHSPEPETHAVWSRDGRRIAFARNTPGPYGGIPHPWVMNADGSEQRQVSAEEGIPSSWSPGDERLLIARSGDIRTVRLDGTDPIQLTTATSGGLPQWSPDGRRIAFHRDAAIWTMRPDGGGAEPLIPRRSEYEFLGSMDWSPDGSRLAYFTTALAEGGRPGVGYVIEVANADGSGRTVIHTLEPLTRPLWSPDGYKILISPYLMNPDGSDKDRVDVRALSWQPIVGTTGHVRPRAAPLLRVSLVPAYSECIDPFYTHGPPIAQGSCEPGPAAPRLTVGARSIGSVRLSVPSRHTDVEVHTRVTDVRWSGSGEGYTGPLELRASLRIADREQREPTTTMDGALAFPFGCTPSAGTVGAECELDTTLNAVLPGAVRKGQRAVWNLGAVRVFDGPDVFLTQGLFIP